MPTGVTKGRRKRGLVERLSDYLVKRDRLGETVRTRVSLMQSMSRMEPRECGEHMCIVC